MKNYKFLLIISFFFISLSTFAQEKVSDPAFLSLYSSDASGEVNWNHPHPELLEKAVPTLHSSRFTRRMQAERKLEHPHPELLKKQFRPLQRRGKLEILKASR